MSPDICVGNSDKNHHRVEVVIGKLVSDSATAVWRHDAAEGKSEPRSWFTVQGKFCFVSHTSKQSFKLLSRLLP